MHRGVYLLSLLAMFSNLLLTKTQPKDLFHNIPQKNQSKEEIEITPLEQQKKLQISLVGDILMDGSVRGQIEGNGMEYPWENVKEYLQNDDITIGNLETSLTNKAIKWPNKQFNFKSDPRNLKYMEDAGIDILSLANNHILDYGYDGLLDTINYIDNTGIKRVGAGKNKEEAVRALIIEKNGLKVGVISASRVVPDVKWYATKKRPGLTGAYDVYIEELLKEIKNTKKDVDLLILSIHWGIEKNPEPKEKDMVLAKKLIDGGVDVIMGHHPHVLQAIEIYKGKPIFYSLGNFVFGANNKFTTNTMIGQINLVDGKMDNIEIIPFNIVAGRPVPVTKDIRLSKIKYMNKISEKFGVNIDETGIIKLENY